MTDPSSEAKKAAVRDLTEGSIARQVILFALPLMLGNVFQMLYNSGYAGSGGSPHNSMG